MSRHVRRITANRFPRGAGNPANQTSPYKSAEAASLSLCEGRNKYCISEAFIRIGDAQRHMHVHCGWITRE
ncbi:hypothetical protein CEXT_161661 [Caerostris extrusa]|uniref:Uncharacterized protein n=1 Tax=Caerostris extrusa TaxID=172846 RepID=A0AAV4ML15_CAEEX|nr:hypothetical protein CEXT_161661 [Caerostris extrusa]